MKLYEKNNCQLKLNRNVDCKSKYFVLFEIDLCVLYFFFIATNTPRILNFILNPGETINVLEMSKLNKDIEEFMVSEKIFFRIIFF